MTAFFLARLRDDFSSEDEGDLDLLLLLLLRPSLTLLSSSSDADDGGDRCRFRPLLEAEAREWDRADRSEASCWSNISMFSKKALCRRNLFFPFHRPSRGSLSRLFPGKREGGTEDTGTLRLSFLHAFSSLSAERRAEDTFHTDSPDRSVHFSFS